MSTTRFKSLCARAALAVAAVLGGVGSAQAATYNGSWDPAFGSKFPLLGWTASAVFNVPDSCLAQGNGIYSPSGACAGFSISNVQVSFYDLTADSGNLNATSLLQTFSVSSVGVPISGIGITGNSFSGVNSSYFGPFTPGPASQSFAGGGNYSFYLSLYISGGSSLAKLAYVNPTTSATNCLTDPAPGDDCGLSTNPATGTFTVVGAIPEPGTYALLLAGLGVMGFCARRRRH